MTNQEARLVYEETLKSMLNGNNRHLCFYGYMLSQCVLEFRESIQTLGVYFKNNSYHLAINPKFFCSFDVKIRAGLLKHEMLHILGNHLTSRFSTNPAANYAMDCSINQLIDSESLPKDHISLKYYQTLCKEELEPKREYEYYLDKLVDSPNSTNIDGNGANSTNSPGDSSRGDHDIWTETEGSEEIRNSVTKDLLDKAVRVASGRGYLPNEVSDFLDLFNNTAKVSWKRELLNFTGRKKIGYRDTILRKSRRFSDRSDLRGRKTLRSYNIVVVLDVSGSMSNKSIIDGLNEIHHICKLTNSTLDLIQVDTEVHNVEKFTKNTKIFNRKASGGTVLEPGIARAAELEADLTIVITDGYCDSPDEWTKKTKNIMFLIDNKEIKFDGYKCFFIGDK